MSRLVRLYKRLLDISLLVSYGLLILLVLFMLYGVFVQAYNFDDVQLAMIKPEYGFLRSILIFLVSAIVIFVVAARLFLSFIENAEKLETAANYRKKMNKKPRKRTRDIAFSDTSTYMEIKHDNRKSKELEDKPQDEVRDIVEGQISFEDEIISSEHSTFQNANRRKKIQKKLAEQPVEDFVSKEEQLDRINDNRMVTSDIGPKTTNRKYYTRLNKSELIGIVAEVTQISNYKSKKFMKALLDTISDEMVQGNEVKIDDFGKFNKRIAKEKVSRNPRTGEAITVPEHGVVKFTAYKKLKDDISNDVVDTSVRYLLTKSVKKELSEDEVQNELIKEEIAKEHVEISVKNVMPRKLKKAVVPKKTKADIIDYISDNTELSKNKANKFLKYLSDVIKDELSKKEDVSISGLGIFTTIKMPRKEAVNPSTNKKIIVPEHVQVRLRFDKTFKDKFR